MIVNQMHWRIGKLMFLALVAIGNALEVPSTTMSANQSFLINATVPTQSPKTPMSEFGDDLKCAKRSLAGPNYNRILPPLPNENPEKRLGVMHNSTKKDSMFKPIIIRITVDILRIMDVNEHEEVIILLLTIKQFWKDSRIKPPPEYMDECPKIKRLSNGSPRYLPEEASKTIWFPDLYLNRIDALHISKVLVSSEAVRVNSHGDVEYAMYGKFQLSCKMSFRHFPLDVQYCPMYVESWRIQTTEQKLKWDPKHPIGLLPDYSIDQFSLRVRVLQIETIKYNTGSFARIGFVLIFTRKLPFYLLQIYFPTVLFVIISWLTFFIPPPYAQGRIILTITTLLALTALNSLISKHSPSASYLRAIDVWMTGCFLFVFASIVDCLVDIRLLYVMSQSYKQEKPSFLMPVSVALVENRQVFHDLFGGEGDSDEGDAGDEGDEDDGGDDGLDATPSIYCDASEPGPSFANLPVHVDTTKKHRVSFAVDSALGAGGMSLLSPQPRRESRALELPVEAPSSQTDTELSEQLERRALRFEKMSIIVYPVLFALFNVCYWGYYLHASKPPKDLAEQISGGFTPRST